MRSMARRVALGVTTAAFATLVWRCTGALRVDAAETDPFIFYALGDYGVTSCQRAFNEGLLDIDSIPAGQPPYHGNNSIGYFECEEVAQRSVAQAMSVLKVVDKPNFVVTLGDNFYTSGLWEAYGLKKQFEQDFLEPYGVMKTPFRIALGDHDHRGNVTAFLRLNELSELWNIDENYYLWPIERFGKSVRIMVIDSVLLEFESGFKQRFGKDFKYLTKDASINHWRWLEDAIQRDGADMNIVVGHKPIYSSAKGKVEYYRERPQADLWVMDRLNALLHKVGHSTPTVYINGHDHVMQHHTEPPINYFGAGNGGFHHHAVAPMVKPNCEFASEVHGFLRMTLRPSGLIADFMGVESTDGVSLRDFMGKRGVDVTKKIWSATPYHTVSVPFNDGR